MLHSLRHRLLCGTRRKIRQLAGKRAVGAEQRADVIGVGHYASIAQRRHTGNWCNAFGAGTKKPEGSF
jgi:cellulase/cellobiase CelA1